MLKQLPFLPKPPPTTAKFLVCFVFSKLSISFPTLGVYKGH